MRAIFYENETKSNISIVNYTLFLQIVPKKIVPSEKKTYLCIMFNQINTINMSENVTAKEFLQGLLNPNGEKYEEYWDLVVPKIRQDMENAINKKQASLEFLETKKFIENHKKRMEHIGNLFTKMDKSLFGFSFFDTFLSYGMDIRNSLQQELKPYSYNNSNDCIETNESLLSTNGITRTAQARLAKQLQSCINSSEDNPKEIIKILDNRILAFAEREQRMLKGSLPDSDDNSDSNEPKMPKDDIQTMIEVLCPGDDAYYNELLISYIDSFAKTHMPNNHEETFIIDADIVSKRIIDGLSLRELQEIYGFANPSQAVNQSLARFARYSIPLFKKIQAKSFIHYYNHSWNSLNETMDSEQLKLLCDLYILNRSKAEIMQDLGLTEAPFGTLLWSALNSFNKYIELSARRMERHAQIKQILIDERTDNKNMTRKERNDRNNIMNMI